MLSSVDFFRSRSALPYLGWLLLSVGLACLFGSIWMERAISTRLASAEAALATANEESRAARARSARVVSPTADEKRLAAAEEESKAPWLQTLRAIEAVATEPIYLRSFVVEPSSNVVKIEAEAPTFADALDFLGAVDSEALFHPAVLVSHDTVSDPAAGKPTIRFSVSGRWNRR